MAIDTISRALGGQASKDAQNATTTANQAKEIAEQAVKTAVAAVPAAVTEWLDDNVDPVGSAVMVDKSLTISGNAADAKVTGDEIGNLKSAIINTNNGLIPVYFDIVKNEYVSQSDGSILQYNGWDRSDYIEVKPGDCVSFDVPITLVYCAYYDINHDFVSTFRANDNITNIIPENVHYMVISGAAENIDNSMVYTIDHLHEQMSHGNLIRNKIVNQYITSADGVITNYYDRSRTDYIYVNNFAALNIKSSLSSVYNAFYDADYNFIYLFSVNAGENNIVVPYNAVYMILSGVNAYVDGLMVNVGNIRSSDSADFLRSTISQNLNGKYYLILNASDLSVGKGIDQSTGNMTDKNNYAVTNSYYKIENTQNKYRMICPASGYGIYVHQYTENSDGTLTYLRRSAYIQNGGTFWAVTGCTHIKIEIYHGNFSPYYAYEFCNSFVFSETNDVNKYLRVCTFNQAADYPHFIRATEEELDKRILNYLNFIGNYNPDIICAQEAVETYFQPISFEKSTSAVFNRKYLYIYQSGHQRKTWSKYNYSQQEMVVFNVQAPGQSRFYGKQTIHFEGKDIVLLNTHCEYRDNSDFDSYRKPQFEQLRDEMAQHEYCILCGDFNAWSAEEFDVFSDYNLANCGDYGMIDTWYIDAEYPDWPFKAIDNIITTKNIVIQNVVRGPYDFNYFSDHAPLIADLQIL